MSTIEAKTKHYLNTLAEAGVLSPAEVDAITSAEAGEEVDIDSVEIAVTYGPARKRETDLGTAHHVRVDEDGDISIYVGWEGGESTWHPVGLPGYEIVAR